MAETPAPHPRLFINATQWQSLALEIKTNPVAKALFAEILRRAEAVLTAPPIVFVKDGRRLLEPARQSESRLILLAMLYRLSGEKKYLDRARIEMREAASVASWNPDHFLDVAEMAFGLAVAYDWLHPWLPEADRHQVEEALLNKALEPSFSGPEKTLWWIQGHNNWNQVCHGGLVAAALALAEIYPDISGKVVQRAVDHLGKAAAAYAPDGAYPEGPTYWCYGTTFQVLLIDALHSVFGDDRGMADFPGFLASADYMLLMNAPSGSMFNYSDAQSIRGASVATGTLARQLAKQSLGFNTTLFWFAQRLARPDLIAHEIKHLSELGPGAAHAADRFLPFCLIWWSAFLEKSASPTETNSNLHALPLHWLGQGVTPVAVHRSAWNDPDARFIGFKGGSPSAPHGHMDVGSFILEADGERWALDLGMHEYGPLEQQGLNLWDMSQESDRWKVFRLGPKGHNLILFNGASQISQARSKLISFQPKGSWPHSIFDLSDLASHQIKSSQRGVALPSDGTLVIRDEWQTAGRETQVDWAWMTRAQIEPEAEGALLLQGGKKLRLRARSSSPWKLVIEDCNEPEGSFGMPNPGLKKIRFSLRTPLDDQGWFEVTAIPTSIATEKIFTKRPKSLTTWPATTA